MVSLPHNPWAVLAFFQITSVRIEGLTQQADHLTVRTGWSSVSPVAGTKRGHTTLDVMPVKDGVVGRPLIRSGPVVQPIDDSACIKAYSTDLKKQVPTIWTCSISYFCYFFFITKYFSFQYLFIQPIYVVDAGIFYLRGQTPLGPLASRGWYFDMLKHQAYDEEGLN